MSEHYDVIVVGGGSAGSMIAGRLASETDAQVLLLESGSWDVNPLIRIPGGFSKIAEQGWYMYDYSTVAQNQIERGPVRFIQGRGIGGGSSINSMAYVVGQKRDYELWDAAAQGEGGWSYDDMLAHFKNMERHDVFADGYHGTDGGLSVSWPPRINSLNLSMMRAFQEIGLPFNEDYNGAHQRGVSPVQLTMRNARRCSAASAFLHPFRKRRNLTIRTRATVERVRTKHGRATGVDYTHFGVHRRAGGGQVVMSAGGFNSPKLLMLSGIGPEQELARHGIDTTVAAPDVGRHLQDHPKVPHVARTREGLGYARDVGGIRMLLDGLAYLLVKDGPAASNGFESVAYSNPDSAHEEPTIQTYHAPLGAGGGPWGLKNPDSGLTFLNVVLHPKSRGDVRLRDTDPRSAPLINPNWLSDPEDMRKMIGAIRYTRQALDTSALRGIVRTESAPGASVQTDEELARYCRSAVDTMWHCIGTCRMGGDDGSVVDPQLRVRGIEGLRVVDGSIMPNLPSGNTNGPVMAIASKGVDFIKHDLLRG